MTDIAGKFIVLTVTHNETRIWATGIEKGTKPEKIHAPEKADRRHFRLDPNIKGSGEQHEAGIYLEKIAQAINGAGEILLIGHGHGKASEMMHLIQYLERKHPLIAVKVVDSIDTNLDAMTEPEILAMARKWFEEYRHFAD